MTTKSSVEQLPDGYLNKTPIFQFILLSCLFALWGVPVSLNDILITQFKTIFNLSDFASALVQSAFYGGYFLIAIPASLIIKKTNYKAGIIIGLAVYVIGCSLFFPASTMATYTMFLAAILAMAFGLSFLETASNTYSSMLGPKKYATLRLNISQNFQPFGAITGVLMGKYLIFQEGASLHSQASKLSGDQLRAFQLEHLQYTLLPYKYIIIVLAIVLVLFILTPYPRCKPVSTENNTVEKVSFGETLSYLIRNKSFRNGIIAQFVYVGMQTAVWSFTIRLALVLGAENERAATNFMLYSFACFFIGKFVANIFMTKFNPKIVLFIYSIIGTILLVYVSFSTNFSAVYAAIITSALMGPCWPTIFANNLEVVDKKYIEIAGAITVMSIVGGAVVPAIQGFVSDHLHSMQHAFMVSAICFAIVGLHFLREYLKKDNTTQLN
ncbi:L-fucose:H+ symporter permease [Commensalibacter papalotli (ex Servin-Garciduenas et al. 2014)]|uniref:L-fucose transporter n=1 Tax=Commensalibacter papalotli (ex Servin-Garciduenas et al. 2014) TaxID=1208583 RepID=W7DVW3_9PROT|nr:L-fucose:H+ symporter permease [Commensalibacter papalotli (ex Servin-Garciduenas et al. 2014)]EUK19185.1 L-fucose transporter [Commensalibacter papalotli (ex Servin-Garciduenas et al. 2014)]